MVRLFYLIILFIILSCSSGHNDKYGIYVPNKPNYSLKGQKSDEIPKELDTLNLYKYVGYVYNNKIVKKKFSEEWNIYTKYCSKGKVYTFGTNDLNEESLNPKFGNKGYYIYSNKKKELKQEVFTNGNGGQFVVLKLKISKDGDTLTTCDGGNSHIYIY